MQQIRWRLNDPAEEQAERWTLIHVLHPGTAAQATGRFGVLIPSDEEITLCGKTVPSHPYMEDRNSDIPGDSEYCQSCWRRWKRMGKL